MLTYRHGFHAGNFADVLKHGVVALLLDALRREEAPLCYLETHAGAGRYDLHGALAQKDGEWQDGIARLWPATAAPAEATPYLDAVHALNADGTLRFYPGSPCIARHLLRPPDRMVLMELHSAELALLQQAFADDGRVAIHHGDGYGGLQALPPPRAQRGLVLIDPAYEDADECDRVIEAMLQSHRRWPTGIHALWYPLLERAGVARLHRRLQAGGIRNILYAELAVKPDDIPDGMWGSGMLLVNPPLQLERQLAKLLPWLWQRLDPQRRGRFTLEWLAAAQRTER